MSERKRQLIAAIGAAANGFQRDEVVDAAGNIILNCLRQEHETKAAAEEQLEAMFEQMRQSLSHDHYDQDGKRRERRIIIPPLAALLNS